MTLTRRLFERGDCRSGLAVAGLLLARIGRHHRSVYSAEAFKAAQASGSPILVEIHADWCPTCKAQKPIIDKLDRRSQVQET